MNQNIQRALLLAGMMITSVSIVSCDKSPPEQKVTPAESTTPEEETMVVDENTPTGTEETAVEAPQEEPAQETEATTELPVSVSTGTLPDRSVLNVVITSKSDLVTINQVNVNRGNCRFNGLSGQQNGSLTMRFGDVSSGLAFCNSISEVSVVTDKGGFTFTFS